MQHGYISLSKSTVILAEMAMHDHTIKGSKEHIVRLLENLGSMLRLGSLSSLLAVKRDIAVRIFLGRNFYIYAWMSE